MRHQSSHNSQPATMPYQAFLTKLIRRALRSIEKHDRTAGLRAGYTACRHRNPFQIAILLKAANTRVAQLVSRSPALHAPVGVVDQNPNARHTYLHAMAERNAIREIAMTVNAAVALSGLHPMIQTSIAPSSYYRLRVAVSVLGLGTIIRPISSFFKPLHATAATPRTASGAGNATARQQRTGRPHTTSRIARHR